MVYRGVCGGQEGRRSVVIYCVDAPPGSGKTSAIIREMNEHPDRKYIYVAPILDEDERIRLACPEVGFIKPYPVYTEGTKKATKMNHIKDLVRRNHSIATTHKAFDMLTPELVEMIREKEYVLIMDETVNVMETNQYCYDDVKTMVDAGNLTYEGDFYRFSGNPDLLEGKSYFANMYRLAYSKNLYIFEDPEKSCRYNPKGKYYYFTMPLDLIKAFKDVYILTYLFPSSELYLLMRMNDVEYVNVGVEKTMDGFKLSESGVYVSDTIKNVKSLIHILRDQDGTHGVGRPKKKFNTYTAKKYNRDRTMYFNLSRTFYDNKKNEQIIQIVRNNNKRFIDRIISEVGGNRANKVIWTVYKSHIDKVKSPKIQNCWIPLNSRATNQYADRTICSWLVELYQQPEKLYFFKKYGKGNLLNERMVCLSTMIQTIFRTAIRSGKEIFLYVPSLRSRSLIQRWVDNPEEFSSASYEKLVELCGTDEDDKL